MQVIPLLIVCVLVALYGLLQPYKSTAVNVLEIYVLSNFLLLLMLQSTQLLKDSYFVFPVPEAAVMEVNQTMDNCQLYSGIATISWILLPFYYLPLFSLVVITAGLLVNYLRLAKLKIYTQLQTNLLCLTS